MQAKWLALLAASAVILGGAAVAAEKSGQPLNIKSSVHKQQAGSWRERAMKARAEFKPEGMPAGGTARARDERGDRRDGEESGGGRLREDSGADANQDE